MILYTCVICEEQHPFDYMHLIDDKLVCNQCHWNALWKTKEVREFEKHNNSKKSVLDLIDRLRGEVAHTSGGEPYATVYSSFDVHEILNEIQNAIEDMEV